jgi:hypothetical protein
MNSKGAIYVLVDEVIEAIRKYDQSHDHLRHASGTYVAGEFVPADCIRCKLVDALPPYAQERIALRKTG